MAWNRERKAKSGAGAAANATLLRKSMTEGGKRLWNMLRYDLDLPEGSHFRRQVAIGNYVVDFVCMRHRLVLEVDGLIHAEPGQVRHDVQRDEFLRQQGFQVARLSNEAVLVRRSEVIQLVREALAKTTPIRRLTRPTDPSPQGGRLEQHS